MFCPADSLLTGEKDDHECQYGEPMCWENDHRLLPNNTEPQEHHRLSACIMFWHDAIRYIWHWKDHLLGQLGQQGADEDKLISELTTFVAACYGSKVEGYMTTHRYQNVEV